MEEEFVLFVEKAHRLETSFFWSWATNKRKIKISDMEKINAGDWLASDGLSPDALDAFCLNLRFLIQKRDGFSIWQIRSISKQLDNTYKSYRNEIETATKELKTQLIKKSLVQIHKGKETSNNDLFEVVFYGGIAHANPDKRILFREITSAGLFSFFVFQAFLGILFDYRNCIQRIAFNLVQYIELKNRKCF